VKVLLSEAKLESTIRRIPQDSFMVLDFVKSLKRLHVEDWKRPVERFGQHGQRRRYTVTTHLSKLDLYSQNPNSLLGPFTSYSKGRFRDYSRLTEEERKHFGVSWIVVFKKRMQE
jgi:hypothetical protein